MPRLWFTYPFKNHDISEFPGVLLPLESSAAHRTSIASSDTQKEKPSETGEAHGIKPLGEKTPGDKKLQDDSDKSSSIINSGMTVESMKAEILEGLAISGDDTPYNRKAKVINKAMQDIGFGKYQWSLLFLCGGGWTADNFWLQGVALTLPQLSAEFNISETTIRYTTLALFLGLCIGSSFWGTASDIIGRRPAFNLTLLIAGAFGLASGGGPNWIGTSALYSCIGLGVGGNLPVDGSLFLEFIPQTRGNLLTALSIFWPLGNLLASGLAMAFIPSYSCAPGLATGECKKEDNMGWRYLILSLGAITMAMFLARVFLFHLYESPKYLLSKGRTSEAVATVYGIANYNKTHTWLTEDILHQIGGDTEVTQEDAKVGAVGDLQRVLSKFSMRSFKSLFSNREMTLTTLLLWFQWTTVGLSYPLFNAFLPQYLANTGGHVEQDIRTVYRDYLITAAVGVFGSVLAYFTVEWKYVGRKGTMGVAALLTGVFIFLFTAANDRSSQLGFSCAEAFFQNIMYGVLYAYTPECFPAPIRGTATGISSFLNRVAGLCAPIVAIQAGNSNPKAPIYASGALFLIAGVTMFALPIETRGRPTM